MAFDGSHGLSIGDPMKKSVLDQHDENDKLVKDWIFGDDAESTGESGHGHTGTGSNDGEQIVAAALATDSVTTAKIKTTEDSGSVTNTSGHVNFDESQYYFAPQFKVSNTAATASTASWLNNYDSVAADYENWVYLDQGSAHTLYVRALYVTASRDLPTVFLLRRISDGYLPAGAYRSETNSPRHPFGTIKMHDNGVTVKPADYAEAGLEVVALELWRVESLLTHIRQNRRGGFCDLEQIHIGLLSGAIEIGDPVKPLFKKNECPVLHAPDVTVRDFIFRGVK